MATRINHGLSQQIAARVVRRVNQIADDVARGARGNAPAAKTWQMPPEVPYRRMVDLARHGMQATATTLQQLIDLRSPARDKPFTDERTGEQIRYLFETPLQKASKAAGLVGPGG
ncbi:hypothetical protein [Nonomuraea sp. NPDC005650]|uniref:hypothetical protein n=1 Tax=Nonomuraea sp. NPDC005650 TaxID=3157045 RepID=UPI0033B30BD3